MSEEGLLRIQREGDKDINLGLFSERLRRLLAGEEGMLPNAARKHIQILYSESETVISWLRDYEYEMVWLLQQTLYQDAEIDSPDLKAIVEEINCFVYDSENVIDTFITDIMQRESESSSKEISDALVGFQSKIIDIKQRLQQVQHIPTDLIDKIKLIQADAVNSPAASRLKKRDTVGLDDKMEELLDLLIEGPPQLSTVAILDSIGIDNTAFAAEAYNTSYVKHYFDCRAWVTASIFYNSDRILDNIMKFLMPSSRWSEIIDKDCEKKKIIFRNFLVNKRYLIVFDDVWNSEIWDDIWKLLPDNQNGSRIIITFGDIHILKSLKLENGEKIQLDSVPVQRLLKAAYQEWPLLILYHGSISFTEYNDKTQDKFHRYQIQKCLLLPFHLKLCYLYMCVFSSNFDYISTKQLYQLWIAEGFIVDNNEVTAENYLEQLISRGLVEVKKRRAEGTIKTCSVPSRFWPVVSIIALRGGLEFFRYCSFDPSMNLQWKKVKRFAALERLIEVDFLDDLYSRLHSFLDFHPEGDFLGHFEEICKTFNFLKVFDLGSSVLHQYSSEIENLILLRYLKLNIPSLKSLPSSLLCNLLNLYTLDMPTSCIDHTADDIWKMNKLRHLNVGLITLPAHPGKYCSSLENLIFISALHPGCCTPDILGRLPSLQNLRISGDLSSYQSSLSKSLCRLSCLESLKLVNESMRPQRSKIVLTEYEFPQSLTQLSLSNTELMEDPMPILEKLPHLQVLKLKQNSYAGRKLACGSDGFPKLRVMHLKSMLWLDEWTMGIGAMPKLECLMINPCAYLKRLPEQLWCMKSFKKLELWWPQPKLRQQMRGFEDREQYDIRIHPYGM